MLHNPELTILVLLELIEGNNQLLLAKQQDTQSQVEQSQITEDEFKCVSVKERLDLIADLKFMVIEGMIKSDDKFKDIP